MAGGTPLESATKPASTPTTPAASSPTNYDTASPAFEAIKPVSADGATASTMPAVIPPTPGTSFGGLPPWLAMWTGASYGQGGVFPGAGSGYQPYVPGSGAASTGQYRPPNIYMPPSKPAAVEEKGGNMFNSPIFDPNSGMYIMPDGKMQFQDRLSSTERAAADAFADWQRRMAIAKPVPTPDYR